MAPESADLLARLEAFQFEPGFVGRLAHENGWSLGQAQRACLEYKRFVFLALAAGHPCAPCDAVDQVWHLHVLHTQDYWEQFCGEVLRAPLHHQPARGAAHEGERFRDWYRNTLASYRRCFGADAPPALWAAPDSYLDGDFQRIDRRGVWLLPKPRWWRVVSARTGAGSLRFWLRFVRAQMRALRSWPRRAFVLASASLAVAGCSAIQRVPPFDLAGPSFLLLFVAIWAISLLAIVVGRGMTRSAAPEAGALQPYELAYLVNGEWQVAQAVVAALVHNNQLRVSPSGETLLPNAIQTAHAGGAPRVSHPLERALLARCAEDGQTGTPLANLIPVVQAESAALAAALRVKGLLYRRDQLRLWRGLALLAPLLGVVKIGVGLALGRPVLYLVLLCAVASVVAWCWLWAARQVTPTGNELLDSLRRDTPNTPGANTDGPSMATMVALFGIAALADGAFADVCLMFPPARARRGWGGSSWSSWSGSDSSWSGSDSSWSGSDSGSSDSSSSWSSSDGGSSCSSDSSSGCGGCGSSD